MIHLRPFLFAALLLSACAETAPDPIPLVNETDHLIFEIAGDDGAAAGQMVRLEVQPDDSYTCVMTMTPLLGLPDASPVERRFTGTIAGLWDRLASNIYNGSSLVVQQDVLPPLSVAAREGERIVSGGLTSWSQTILGSSVEILIDGPGFDGDRCFAWG